MPTLAEARERALHWCEHAYGARGHSTTRRMPKEQVKEAALLPAPGERYHSAAASHLAGAPHQNEAACVATGPRLDGLSVVSFKNPRKVVALELAAAVNVLFKKPRRIREHRDESRPALPTLSSPAA